jgi:hypothetical protein
MCSFFLFFLFIVSGHRRRGIAKNDSSSDIFFKYHYQYSLIFIEKNYFISLIFINIEIFRRHRTKIVNARRTQAGGTRQ